MSTIQKTLKLFCKSCCEGSLSNVIKVVNAFTKSLPVFSILLEDDNSILIIKVNNTLISSKKRNTPVNIGFLGLFIIYKNAVAISTADTIIISMGLTAKTVIPAFVKIIYIITQNRLL